MTSQAANNATAPRAQPTERHNLPRATRPNYNQIHALPMPLCTHPLPPLIPHNPLSLLQIVYTYLAQVLRTPCSHPPVLYTGYVSLETLSIHVTDPRSIRALWEMGFFGKGSLSRSEPSWLDREKRRLGLLAGETSEEVTRRRREERKEFKKERARREREVIEQKLRQEGKIDLITGGLPVVHDFNGIAADGPPAQLFYKHGNTEDENRHDDLMEDVSSVSAEVLPDDSSSLLPQIEVVNQSLNFINSKPVAPFIQPKEGRISLTNIAGAAAMMPDAAEAIKISNQEHLQLTFEEAFFLLYGLGVLDVVHQGTNAIFTTASLFSLFRRHSYFPPRPSLDLRPDDPFLISYVVYHHFRSLGWVVRPGVKFAVDYLLYNRGPVFSHAEFGVMIIPSYSHSYWTATPTRKKDAQRNDGKSWWWLHCVNRVQSQVRKSLVLAYVDIPPPGDETTIPASAEGTHEGLDVGQVLKRYKIREVTLKRWVPNRSRD